MRVIYRAMMLTILLPCLAAAAQEAASRGAEGAPAPAGAKDLFFDPAGGTAVPSEPPAASAKPPHTAPKARRVAHQGASRVEQCSSQAVGLRYKIELDEPRTIVTDTKVFHSGQRIRLLFKSKFDGYIHLLQLSASGTAEQLFPNAAKGLADNRMQAENERVLPSETSWFRFDNHPGTEMLIVIFACDESDLRDLPMQPRLGPADSQAVLAAQLRGSKDLLLETETRAGSDQGTYAMNRQGKPLILTIPLQHQ